MFLDYLHCLYVYACVCLSVSVCVCVCLSVSVCVCVPVCYFPFSTAHDVQVHQQECILCFEHILSLLVITAWLCVCIVLCACSYDHVPERHSPLSHTNPVNKSSPWPSSVNHAPAPSHLQSTMPALNGQVVMRVQPTRHTETTRSSSASAARAGPTINSNHTYVFDGLNFVPRCTASTAPTMIKPSSAPSSVHPVLPKLIAPHADDLSVVDRARKSFPSNENALRRVIRGTDQLVKHAHSQPRSSSGLSSQGYPTNAWVSTPATFHPPNPRIQAPDLVRADHYSSHLDRLHSTSPPRPSIINQSQETKPMAVPRPSYRPASPLSLYSREVLRLADDSTMDEFSQRFLAESMPNLSSRTRFSTPVASGFASSSLSQEAWGHSPVKRTIIDEGANKQTLFNFFFFLQDLLFPCSMSGSWYPCLCQLFFSFRAGLSLYFSLCWFCQWACSPSFFLQ